jgi:hypothetical protein
MPRRKGAAFRQRLQTAVQPARGPRSKFQIHHGVVGAPLCHGVVLLMHDGGKESNDVLITCRHDVLLKDVVGERLGDGVKMVLELPQRTHLACYGLQRCGHETTVLKAVRVGTRLH